MTLEMTLDAKDFPTPLRDLSGTRSELLQGLVQDIDRHKQGSTPWQTLVSLAVDRFPRRIVRPGIRRSGRWPTTRETSDCQGVDPCLCRSDEHTSAHQSPDTLACRVLLYR